MFWLVVASILFLPLTSPAQFEGTIGMRITVPEGDSVRRMTYQMYVRKDMLMTEVRGDDQEAERGKFIFRGDRQVLWIVNDREKDYLEISLKEKTGAAHGEEVKDSGAAAQASALRKTGKSESILGYSCDEYVVEEGSRTSHIWGTKRLGDIYDALRKSFGSMGESDLIEGASGWENELAAEKIFPLRIVTTSDGNLEESQEVVSINEQRVDPSTFELPNDYTKQSLEFDMNKLIQSMQEKMDKQRLGEQDTTGGKHE